MVKFFKDVAYEQALEIEKLSKLTYELRENRQVVLATYGVEHEEALLEQISTGAVAEHPAYEHYLAARILADTRESARALIAERLQEASKS